MAASSELGARQGVEDLVPLPSILRKAAVCFLAIAGQFLFLRLLLHYGLGVRIGWAIVETDFQLIFPVPVAFFFLYMALDVGQPTPLRLQKKNLKINISLIGLTILLNAFMDPLKGALGSGFWALWLLLMASTFASACFLFVPTSFFFKNKNKLAVYPACFIAASVTLYSKLTPFIWNRIAPATARLCAVVLNLFSNVPVTESVYPRPGYFALSQPKFNLLVCQGCGGFEGFILFLSVMFIVRMVWPEKFQRRWLFFTALGTLIMYCTNILRICLFYRGGLWLFGVLERPVALKVFNLALHAYTGWILYGFVIVSYLWVLHRFASRTASEPLGARQPFFAFLSRRKVDA